jgi:nucleoside-diphosphate-sugar epimerase
MDQTPSGKNALLVSGGSGFIGRQLVKALAEKGLSVVSLYHHRLPEPMPNVFPVCSDLSSSELLMAPMRNIDTVVHLAWHGTFSTNIGFSPNDGGEQTRNLKVTKNLIQAAEKAGVRRFIFASTLGAGERTQLPFYREKYSAEHLVINSSIESKVIVRLAPVYSQGEPGDKFVSAITNLCRSPLVYPIPNAKAEVRPLFIRDAVASLLAATELNLHGQSVHIAEVPGLETLKVEDLFKLLISKGVAKGSKLALKGSVGNFLTRMLEKDAQKTGRLPQVIGFLNEWSTKTSIWSESSDLSGQFPIPKHTMKEIAAIHPPATAK